MKFPLDDFLQFCRQLTIDSKEAGQIKLRELLGTQMFVLKMVVRALEDERHQFVILKARQLGVTTITLALDLFWHYRYPGMQGTLAADSEENRDQLRDTLSTYHKGLPPPMRVRALANNRNLMAFANRSRILFQIAGGKQKGKKGRGKGITFIHGTECALWDDQASLESILSSLAQHNPLRFHLFESTAKGVGNPWEDMWKRAKLSNRQAAIFVGWWLNEYYAIPRDDHAFSVYWGEHGAPTPEERDRARAVKLMYGYDITPEQFAWYRYMQAEQFSETTDGGTIEQEFPWHEEMAWILTGTNFFSLPQIAAIKQEVQARPPPRCYRFIFTDDFTETELVEVPEALAHLKVWEMPDHKDGHYSVGADPAYGSSDWADRYVCGVWRCYADRFEQVAEFCTPDLTTYRFAWVVCYLAGFYRNCMINLEINGPGEAVLSEMGELRRRSKTLNVDTGDFEREKKIDITDFLSHISYYLYQRLDQYGGGYVQHWKTTPASKERLCNVFRDALEKRLARIWSEGLLDEMKNFVREDGVLKGSGRAKDDRVIAACLAAEQYIRHMRFRLEQYNVTWVKELKRRHELEVTGTLPPEDNTVLGQTIRKFLERAATGLPMRAMRR